MKVKELVEHLTHFNPNAEIEIIVNYKEKNITEICWDSGDAYCDDERNIEKEKMNAEKVFLDTDISDKKEITL